MTDRRERFPIPVRRARAKEPPRHSERVGRVLTALEARRLARRRLLKWRRDNE